MGYKWIGLGLGLGMGSLCGVTIRASLRDAKKDMRITNCMIYLALSWKRLMIFVIQFQKRT